MLFLSTERNEWVVLSQHTTFTVCVYHVPGIVLGSVGTGDIMLKEKKNDPSPQTHSMQWS